MVFRRTASTANNRWRYAKCDWCRGRARIGKKMLYEFKDHNVLFRLCSFYCDNRMKRYVKKIKNGG